MEFLYLADGIVLAYPDILNINELKVRYRRPLQSSARYYGFIAINLRPKADFGVFAW